MCKVENGKEYPIVWMKKSEDGDSKPLSTGKNLVMDNTSKWTLRSGTSWDVGYYSSSKHFARCPNIKCFIYSLLRGELHKLDPSKNERQFGPSYV